MKKLLVIAVAAALAAPAAMADTTLYGKLHVSVGSVKAAGGTSETVVESNTSRMGVKGSTALDNGMEATYGLEYGLNLDGENTSSTATANGLTARNTFVGLKGKFGEVRVGRHDTPAKLATAGQDIFADTYADMSNVILADNLRVDNAVAYINKFGPVTFAAAHSTAVGMVPTGPLGLGTVDLGTQDVNGGRPDANDLMVAYGNGPWSVGLGHTAVQGVLKNTNVGLGWKAEAGHAVNLVMENTKITGTPTTVKGSILNGAYKMGNITLKGQLGQSKVTGSNTAKANAVGLDYSFGKKTSVYGLLTQTKSAAGAKGHASVVGLVTEF